MPGWFRWWDLVTFGGPGILVGCVAAWVQTTDSSGQAKALTWAVAAMFLAIYAAVVFLRWRASRR